MNNRQEAIDKAREILGTEFVHVKSNNKMSLLDFLVEIKETEDIETIVELKNNLIAMFESEIVYRLKSQ